MADINDITEYNNNQPQAYLMSLSGTEIESLLEKVKNMEYELIDSDNPVSSKAVLEKYEELKKICE